MHGLVDVGPTPYGRGTLTVIVCLHPLGLNEPTATAGAAW